MELKGDVRQSMNRSHSMLKPAGPSFSRRPEGTYCELTPHSLTILELLFTPTLSGGQTWVCMRFWSGRVRSEFCEEDWE